MKRITTTPKPITLLTSWGFLLALAILLLNDQVLKGAFGNFLTGKLSDFAGLFVFPLFWAAIFPRFRKAIFPITALLFVLWKLPISDPFIALWNDTIPFPIARVTDPTDLFALIMVPLAAWYAQNRRGVIYNRMHPAIPIIFSAFALTATSYNTDLPSSTKYQFNYSLDSLNHRLYSLEDVSVMYPFCLYPKAVEIPWQIRPYDTLFPDKLNDTMTLAIDDEFCNGYDATIVISGDSYISELELLGYCHTCPPDGESIIPIKRQDDEKLLNQSFTQKVIAPLTR